MCSLHLTSALSLSQRALFTTPNLSMARSDNAHVCKAMMCVRMRGVGGTTVSSKMSCSIMTVSQRGACLVGVTLDSHTFPPPPHRHSSTGPMGSGIAQHSTQGQSFSLVYQWRLPCSLAHMQAGVGVSQWVCATRSTSYLHTARFDSIVTCVFLCLTLFWLHCVASPQHTHTPLAAVFTVCLVFREGMLECAELAHTLGRTLASVSHEPLCPLSEEKVYWS